MKQLTLTSSKQRGFTLLESLIALLIFSIVVLGSATAISRMLQAQKEMQQNSVILNLMQNKLQQALNRSSGVNVCDAVNKDRFEVAQQAYFIACATENIQINSTRVDWPVLAVSTTAAKAQACAQGTNASDCYVVGR